MKTTATLLIAIFMISAFTVVIPTLNAVLTPTIDGVIAEGEWDGATSFEIGPCTGYVTNDDQYMYVAYDYAIKTIGEWANIITYKAGSTPERIRISWVFVKEAGLVPQRWVVKDTHTVVDGKRGVAEPDGLFTSFEVGVLPLVEVDTVDIFGKLWTGLVYAVDSATEMAIPLTEIGLTPGDSIKIMPGLNLLPNTIFVYPDSGTEDDDLTIVWAQDPDHYADYTLWEPEPVFYNLDITISGQGQVTYIDPDIGLVETSGDGATLTMSYEAGALSDVFTAQTWKEHPDWEFVSWTVHTSQGDIVSYEPTGFIPMYEHTSVTATFARTRVPTIQEAVYFIEVNVEHYGIANSLISKLENVQDRNYEKILNAFINEVDAQTDKKVPSEVASLLIEWAKAWSLDPDLA